MNIQELSSNDFYSVSQSRRIITHEHPRRFAVIDPGGNCGVYGLSWRSNKIEPVIKVAAERFLWVGVDQGLAAVDLKTGEVRLSLSLNSNLLQLLVEDDLVVALNETEAIFFNANLSIRFIKGLPDVPDSLSLNNHQATIRLIDGQHIVFNVDSGSSLSRAA